MTPMHPPSNDLNDTFSLPKEPIHYFYPIEDFATLRCEGEDAKTFLQGQLTADVDKVSTEQATLACCVNLKGRAISSFILVQTAGHSYDLLLPEDVAQITLDSLKKYAVFSKVSLNLLEKQPQILGIGAQECVDDLKPPLTELGFSPNPLNGILYSAQLNDDCNSLLVQLPGPTPRALLICHERGAGDMVDLLKKHAFEPCTNAFWLAHQAVAGEVFISKALSESIIPNTLNYDQLNAISFDKGCYRGQEIIARLHYRGESKEGLFLALAPWDNTNLPKVGADITDENKTVGKVLISSAILPEALLCLIMLRKNCTEKNGLHFDGAEIQKLLLQKISYNEK